MPRWAGGGEQRARSARASRFSRVSVVVSGFDLSAADVVAVARARSGVTLADGVRERLEAACRTLDRALASGTPVYCVSVGAGASKASSVDPGARERFEHLLVRNGMVGQGPPVSPDAVRATLLVVVNLLASGRSAAAPRPCSVSWTRSTAIGSRPSRCSARSDRPTSRRSRTWCPASSATSRSPRERPSR